MKPLLVLLIVFVLVIFGVKIFLHQYGIALAARIAMGAMLLFTAIAHFAFTKGMAMMLPAFVPYKNGLVYLTGVIEIAAAIGLQITSMRLWAAWLLIVFFILLLPANIYAAAKNINYQTGTYDGSGLSYLWFRMPLQILFIAWVYFSAVAN